MLQVSEIFHSIQGESTHAGRPCVFIRLAGCHLRCVWCDTSYAFHGGVAMGIEEVLDQVRGYRCGLVELTGGEPLLQPDALELLDRLVELGYEVLLETSGSLPIEKVPAGVRRIIDIKCPGSGESEKNLWSNLEHLRQGDELKFVVAGRSDYLWAKGQIERRELEGRCPLLLSPVHERLDPQRLAAWVLEDRLPVRVQIQLHKLLWPSATRGV